MTFRPAKRPGRNSSKPRTQAQIDALTVFRLRGLWSHAWALTGARREAMQKAIDDELALLGVETQTARRARERAELEAAE